MPPHEPELWRCCMALVRRGSRRITVDGTVYRWHACTPIG